MQVRQVWYVGPDGELELLEVVLIGSSRAVPAAVRAHMAREARRTAERGRSMNTRQARHHDAKASRLASTAAGLERAAIAAETLTPEAAEIVTPEILLADAEAHRRMAAWLSGLAAQLRALPAERHPADAANVSADASVGGPGQASEGVCDAFARFRREFLRAEATEWEENAAAGTPLRHRGVVDEPFIYVRDGGFAATRT